MTQLEIPFPEVPAPATLADAVAFYHDANSEHPRKAAIRSALRAVGRGIGLPLDQISADPIRLRELLASASAGNAGVKPSSWRSIKSQALTALREAGVDLATGRDPTTISPGWAQLLEGADRRAAIGLGRFLKYLSREGIQPTTVAADAFSRWRQELIATSPNANPETSYRQMVRLWKVCERRIAGWPRIEVDSPEDPRRFSLPWEAFPESFRTEVDAFLTARIEPDPLSLNPARKVRPDTCRGWEKNLRAYASALVLSGVMEVAAITSLSVLSEPRHVRAALGYLRDKRFGGKVSPHLLNHAELMKTIARHFEEDEAKAVQIGALIKSLKGALGQGGGMTLKNRQRLSAFDDPKMVKRLLELPQRTLRAACAGPHDHRAAVRVMYALQVAILLAVPLRAKNLTALKLGENITESGKGKTRQVRLFVSREETKTHTDFTAILPDRVVVLLDAWRETWRPLVCGSPSVYLFPNSSGGLRSRESLSAKFSGFVERETGLKMNVHLFRHLAAKLYLAWDPNGVELVRQLLGHSTIKTTLKAYADLKTEPAFLKLEEALFDVYERPASRRRGVR